MSFGDLESGRQTKQWCGDDSLFEQDIKGNVQEMQESMRCAIEHLEHFRKARTSKRASDSLDKSLGKSQDLAEKTEQLFRDWTVHLAGEPAVRHKKKLSYEKLQKAFGEEADRLKAVGRQASVIRREAFCSASKSKESPGMNDEEHCLLSTEERQTGSSSIECHGMCEDQSTASGDEEHFLLATGPSTAMADDCLIQNRIAHEREERIKRIGSQVLDVNQMFRDLASIVHEQGEQFTTIEQQAQSASSNTMLATKEIKKASDRQRSSSERLCCLLATAMLVLCFVLVESMPHLVTALPGKLK